MPAVWLTHRACPQGQLNCRVAGRLEDHWCPGHLETDRMDLESIVAWRNDELGFPVGVSRDTRSLTRIGPKHNGGIRYAGQHLVTRYADSDFGGIGRCQPPTEQWDFDAYRSFTCVDLHHTTVRRAGARYARAGRHTDR